MRWSLQDGTTTKHGYLRILYEGMDIGIDVFPFRQGGDPMAIRAKALAIVDALNAAEEWRHGSRYPGSPAHQLLKTNVGAMLARAVDAFREPATTVRPSAEKKM